MASPLDWILECATALPRSNFLRAVRADESVNLMTLMHESKVRPAASLPHERLFCESSHFERRIEHLVLP